MTRWPGGNAIAKLYLGYVRNVPDHPLKLRILRLGSQTLLRGGVPVVAPNGARLLVSPEDWIGRQIVFHGQYEAATLARATSLMAEGGVFVDVGACFGLYTCTLGVLPGVRAIAVEPSAEAFVQLRRNVAMNPSVSSALYHVATTASPGLEALSFPDATNLGKARIERRAAPSGYTICGVSLATVLEREKATPLRLVKLDVEGMEMSILRSLDWSGHYRPQHVIMELNENAARRGETPEECAAYFAERGYEACTVEGLAWRPGQPLPESNVWFRGQ